MCLWIDQFHSLLLVYTEFAVKLDKKLKQPIYFNGTHIFSEINALRHKASHSIRTKDNALYKRRSCVKGSGYTAVAEPLGHIRSPIKSFSSVSSALVVITEYSVNVHYGTYECIYDL